MKENRNSAPMAKDHQIRNTEVEIRRHTPSKQMGYDCESEEQEEHGTVFLNLIFDATIPILWSSACHAATTQTEPRFLDLGLDSSGYCEAFC